jgi:hypothetical protein
MERLSAYYFEGTFEEFNQLTEDEFRVRFGGDAVRALCPIDSHVLTKVYLGPDGDEDECPYCNTSYLSLERGEMVERARRRVVEFIEEKKGLTNEVEKMRTRIRDLAELIADCYLNLGQF